MPPQLKTLLPFLAVFICLFLVARHLLIPESFGKYGHYRANSIIENEALTIHYAGKANCVECHDTEAAKLASDKHAGLSCEVCHGPGVLHIDDPEKNKLIKSGTRESCGRCHNINLARRTEIIHQIDIKEHNPEHANCIDCHNPHAVWEMRE